MARRVGAVGSLSRTEAPPPLSHPGTRLPPSTRGFPGHPAASFWPAVRREQEVRALGKHRSSPRSGDRNLVLARQPQEAGRCHRRADWER